jgi:chromosomal replication initiation ATPase DnaA
LSRPLRTAIAAAAIQNLIKPLKFQTVANTVTLTAPNRFVLQWIRDRFNEIQRLAADRLGADIKIDLVLAEKEVSRRASRAWPKPLAANRAREIFHVSIPNLRSRRL